MRILICCKQDLTSCIALNALLQSWSGSQDVRVVLSDKQHNYVVPLPAQFDFNFYERDLFLFWAQSQAAVAKNSSAYVPFQHFPQHYGVSVDVLQNLSQDTRYLHKLSRWQPHVIVSIRYNYVFKQGLIDLASEAVLNLHPGQLPQYGGFFAPFWAMKNDAKQLTCTLHEIRDERLDSGDIISEFQLAVQPSKSLMWHFTELYWRGVHQLVTAIQQLETAEPFHAIKQNDSERVLYGHPELEDFLEYEQKTGQLIRHSDYLARCQLFSP